MPRLSDTTIRAAIRTAIRTGKGRKLYDELGLYLQLTPKANKCGSWWRQRYKWQGKAQLLSLGTYPDVGLADAREKRAVLRKQVANDIDPSVDRKAKQAAKIDASAQTFEAVARAWHTKFSPGWSPSHAKRVLRRLEMHVFPTTKDKNIAEVTGADAQAILDKLAGTKKIDTAVRVLQYVKDIAIYAVGRKLIAASPFAHVLARRELPKVKVKHRAAIKEPKLFGALLRSIEDYPGSYVVKCALKFLSLTFVRPIECRQARWAEFELNGKKPLWRISAWKMKMRDDFLVPLSTQVVSLLLEIKEVTGDDRHGRVFPGERPGRPLSENTLNNGVRLLGFSEEQHCSHGFRGTASTLLNEHQWPGDVIELQLAHDERDETRASYNAAQHLPTRHEMMQWWADSCDSLKSGGNVIATKSTKR